MNSEQLPLLLPDQQGADLRNRRHDDHRVRLHRHSESWPCSDPIFSPTDFVQIKGRGTRRHNFLDQLHDPGIAENVAQLEKTTFKLFRFLRKLRLL